MHCLLLLKMFPLALNTPHHSCHFWGSPGSPLPWLYEVRWTQLTSAIQQKDRLIKKIMVCPYPPHSPAWTLCDFWLFPRVKVTMKGKCFESIQDFKSATTVQFKILMKETSSTAQALSVYLWFHVSEVPGSNSAEWLWCHLVEPLHSISKCQEQWKWSVVFSTFNFIRKKGKQNLIGKQQ